MSTTPDNEAPTGYPDSWKPRGIERHEFADQVDDYIAALSDRELQALLARTRGPRRK